MSDSDDVRHTPAEVAALLGRDISTVRRLARDLGVGQLVTRSLRLYTAADVAALRRAVSSEWPLTGASARK